MKRCHKKNIQYSKGLWSSKKVKDLYILDNRLGSSSMYKIENKNFDLHNIKKNYDDFKITRTIQVECDTLENVLQSLILKVLIILKSILKEQSLKYSRTWKI